jgi:hypothetical protein
MVVSSRCRPSELLVATGVLVVAFGARLTAALKGSGLDGIMYYDEGVNFAAAFGLGHGRCHTATSCFCTRPGLWWPLRRLTWSFSG